VRIAASPYELKAKSAVGTSAGATRQGALLRFDFDEFGPGYADCHPWPELGDAPLSEQLARLARGQFTRLSERSHAQARVGSDSATRLTRFGRDIAYGTLEGAIANAIRERPRVQAALRDEAERLHEFKEIATLVDVPVKRPPDGQTDYLGGAQAARERGMNRLAERLERLAPAA